ncbi:MULTISPECIES: hypothetical protein [unclassified Corynebacterium]|uniref:hypothetical protein n=1 Tax=unclassified Corynebacterium TaxID=2624378 RepID=UPI001D0E3C2C|nr:MULTISPECIES: hypothetical protein [unclassified Corynebacterium]
MSCLLIVAFTVAWMRWVEGRPMRGVLARPGTFWLGTAIIVPLMLVVHLLYIGIGYLRGAVTTEFLGQYPTGWVLVGSVIFAFVRSYILQGLPEELVYRGWLADVTRDIRALPWPGPRRPSRSSIFFPPVGRRARGTG